MKQINSLVTEKLIQFANGLIDQERARVIVPANDQQLILRDGAKFMGDTGRVYRQGALTFFKRKNSHCKPLLTTYTSIIPSLPWRHSKSSSINN